MTGAFSTLLVANRGEIALRILRTARAMGLRTVAVYTDADADSPHVAAADRALRIGAGPVGDSYLSAEAILAAAQETGAEAIHPGYGFLSDNADFAARVAKAGLVFVGPSPEVIALMGDKAAARRRMQAAGVPCLPGYDGAAQDDATLAQEAARIGWPVMIKAAAGGGGRGMRVVERAEEFAQALALARAEAAGAFGDDRMILERALLRPRHVEVQVMADTHGHVLHLGERDCSVQRRHQKVIEEAPAPGLGAELRARLCETAVRAAAEIGYIGAGTVEFLLEDGAFWFLEMNTRLQVEHPVTEMVTGLDLVALQLAAAQGQPLGIAQEDVTVTGHAIEARLCAEDAANGFLPATGTLLRWHPGEGEGLRVDAGIAEGQAVSPHYDSLLAKVVAHGDTREAARERLISGLARTVALGVPTNRAFLVAALEQPEFVAGPTTAFLEDAWGGQGWTPRPPGFQEAALAAALLWTSERDAARAASPGVPGEQMGWSGMGPVAWPVAFEGGWALTVAPCNAGVKVSDGTQSMTIDPDGAFGRADRPVTHAIADGRVYLSWADADIRFDRADPGKRADMASDGSVRASMHGVLRQIDVTVGKRVAAGARLAVLEAMKMQHALVAPISGRVRHIAAAPGDQVSAGAVLIEIEAEDSDAAG